MLIKIDFSALADTKWHEYALRFLFMFCGSVHGHLNHLLCWPADNCRTPVGSRREAKRYVYDQFPFLKQPFRNI